MAARKPTKSNSTRKPPTARPAPSKAVRPAANSGQNPLQAAIERLEASVAELSSTRERLGAELTAARKQVAVLEAARLDAVNRLDWAIDSLQSAIQK